MANPAQPLPVALQAALAARPGLTDVPETAPEVSAPPAPPLTGPTLLARVTDCLERHDALRRPPAATSTATAALST